VKGAIWVGLLGIGLGLLTGSLVGLMVPPQYARYIAVGILAGLDSLLGGWRADLEGAFETRIFLSGFVGNTLMAVLLTFLADRLGVELYLAAIVAFGVRIFNNLAIIRRKLFLENRSGEA
jgi:small basic protein